MLIFLLSKSRYVGSMLKVAEERERQEIRIQERKLQRELEQELKQDPSLKDNMEAFVTDAYRKQQELIKQMEEEDRRREAEEAKNKTKDGFTGFYKNLLDSRTSTVEAVQKQLKDVKAAEQKDTSSSNKPTSSVDYNQPLKGGLNVFQKPPTIRERLEEAGKSAQDTYRRDSWREQQRKKESMERDRLSRQFEQQLEEHEREEAKRKQEEEELLKKKYQRQTDEDAVSEAKRRFEERRKQRQLERQNRPPTDE